MPCYGNIIITRRVEIAPDSNRNDRKMETSINYSALPLDRESPEPMYLQLKNALAAEIKTLQPNRDFMLPSERELAVALNLSRPTTHHAYEELLKERLVCRQPNKSLRVRQDARERLLPPFPTIGLVVPRPFSEFLKQRHFSILQYFSGIISRAAELNISVNIIQLPPPDCPEARVLEFIERMISPLTGVIHFGTRQFQPDKPLETLLHYTGVPQVLLSAYSPLPHIGSVGEEIRPAIRSIIRQLKRSGAKTIGILNHHMRFDPDAPLEDINYYARKRCHIIREELASAGLPVRPEHVLDDCLTGSALKRFLRNLLARNEVPELFLCGNDETAAAALACARELGVAQGRFSVIGIDGKCIPDGVSYDFPTMRVPFQEIGAEAVNLLQVHFLQGISEENRHVHLPAKYIKRP